MAENYSLGSRFGFNVSQQGAKAPTVQPKEVIQESVENIFESITGYVAKYENVFNGDVEKEIGMYSRQAMIVGMNLKSADKNHRNFDMNI